MKKLNFLVKLNKKGNLKLVEPNEEMKESYIEKSDSNFISAKILIKNKRLEESVSLAYYSMYHILMALLFRVGIKSENHSASIILLKEIFDIDNSKISFAKKERIDKQYYVDFHITKKDVEDLIDKAEEFSKKLLDFISKLNNQDIRRFRNKYIDLLK